MRKFLVLGILVWLCWGIIVIPKSTAIDFEYWKGDKIQFADFSPNNNSMIESLTVNVTFSSFPNSSIGHGLIHNFTVYSNYNNQLTYLVDINVYTLGYYTDTSIWLSTEDIPNQVTLNLTRLNPRLNSNIRLIFEVRYRYQLITNITAEEIIHTVNYNLYYTNFELIPALNIYPFVIAGIGIMGIGLYIYYGRKTKPPEITLFREGTD